MIAADIICESGIQVCPESGDIGSYQEDFSLLSLDFNPWWLLFLALILIIPWITQVPTLRRAQKSFNGHLRQQITAIKIEMQNRKRGENKPSKRNKQDQHVKILRIQKNKKLKNLIRNKASVSKFGKDNATGQKASNIISPNLQTKEPEKSYKQPPAPSVSKITVKCNEPVGESLSCSNGLSTEIRRSSNETAEQRIIQLCATRLQLCNSSDFGDISTAPEDCHQGKKRKKNVKKVKKTTMCVGKQTSRVPRLPKLKISKVATTKSYNRNAYEFEIDQHGGMIKLPSVTLSFPPMSVKSKIKLNLAVILCRKQRTRREDKDAIFETDALHLWEPANLKKPDEHESALALAKPFTIYLSRINGESSQNIKVQRTESTRNIAWEFHNSYDCTGDNVSFETTKLGGYRAVTSKHGTTIHLNYKLFLIRTPGTDDPYCHNCTLKFYDDEMRKGTLKEVAICTTAEELLDGRIKVEAGSTLQVSVSGKGIKETEMEFSVPVTGSKIKKSSTLALMKKASTSELHEPLRLLFKLSSPLSAPIENQFDLVWQREVPNPTIKVDINVGKNAVGIVNNYS